MKTKTYKVVISEEANKRIEDLMKIVHDDDSLNRITKGEITSIAILEIIKEKVLGYARNNRSLKHVVKKYFEQHKENHSANDLLTLIQQQISSDK